MSPRSGDRRSRRRSVRSAGAGHVTDDRSRGRLAPQGIAPIVVRGPEREGGVVVALAVADVDRSLTQRHVAPRLERGRKGGDHPLGVADSLGGVIMLDVHSTSLSSTPPCPDPRDRAESSSARRRMARSVALPPYGRNGRRTVVGQKCGRVTRSPAPAGAALLVVLSPALRRC